MPDCISFIRPLPEPRPVRMDGRPLTVELDLSRTALIVVDMQNDFAHPEGWFGARGEPVDQALALVAPINELTSALRPLGVPVIWLNWGVRADCAELPASLVARGRRHAQAPTYGDPSPSGDGRILVEREWGADLLAGLHVEDADIRVSKSRLSGFVHNGLDAILRNRDITTLLFAGVNTDRCVFASLQDAGFLGYDCILLSDLTATASAPAATAVIHDLVANLHGVVATAADLISAIATPSIQEVNQ